MNNKSRFGTVFAFTWEQNTKGKSFKFLTFILPILLFMIAFAIEVVPALIKDSQLEENKIQKVEVYGTTEDMAGLKAIIPVILEAYEKSPVTAAPWEFISDRSVNDRLKELEAGQSETDVIIMSLARVGMDDDREITGSVSEVMSQIKEGSTRILIKLWNISFSKVDSELLTEAGKYLSSAITSNRISNSGVAPEKIQYVFARYDSTTRTAGAGEDTVGKMLVKMIGPMLFSLIMYMMVFMYGQGMSKIVVVEKNSKLVETMLTTMKPIDLIMGKIVAMALTGIMQFVLWIAGILGGLLAGNMTAKAIDPEAADMVGQVFTLIREEASSAFTLPALIFSLAGIALGFFFYCVLAGFSGALVTKAEETAGSNSIFMMLVVIGFLGGYMVPLLSNPAMSEAIRYIPFTAAFVLPSDILVGNVSLIKGVLLLGLLGVFDIIACVVTAKVYKSRIFYNGQGMFGWLKAMGKKN